MCPTANGSAPIGTTQFNDTVNRIYDKVDGIHKELIDISIALARLETSFKIKSGIWGVLGGLIPTTGVLIWILIKQYTKI